MNKKIRSLPVNELFWLISLCSFSFFICGLLLGLEFLQPDYDLNMPLLDTSVRIPGPALWIITFSSATFLVYFIRMLARSFWNLLANFIFLASAIGLMIIVGFLLSRLGPAPSYEAHDAFNFLAILQCLFIGLSAYAGIKTLRRIKRLTAT